MVYARKKRNYGKKVVKKSYRKTNTIVSRSSRAPRLLSSSNLSFPFPNRYKTLMRTIVTAKVDNALAGTEGNAIDLFFKMNCLTSVGPSVNYPLGTQAVYANNVPSSLIYLLANDSQASQGSIAPYSKYRVISSSISVEYTTKGTTNAPCELIVVPRSIPYNNGNVLTTNTLNEQPYCKSIIIPAVLNEKATIVKHSINVASLFGIKSLGNDDESFVGTASAEPSSQCIWHVRLRNLDNEGTARAGAIRVTVNDMVEFFDTNTFSSNVPAS